MIAGNCGRRTEHAQETNMTEDEAEPQEQENAENAERHWDENSCYGAELTLLDPALTICHRHGCGLIWADTDEVLELRPR